MKTVLYRGSLKSCNYHCSYCPFSKHGAARNELEKDRKQWFSFAKNYREQAFGQKICAVMVTPYGEALVHPWYWEGLACMSACSFTKAVGAQTNLSFLPQTALEIYAGNGGIVKKLRLWATFHPEMTTVAQFAEKCRLLAAEGITLCAGAVGVPQNMALLQQLRAALPQEIYLWINRMDGLGRAYTQDEIQCFSDIDPYFYRELQVHPADASQCLDRLFLEGDGKRRLCNISAAYQECRRKACTCYLAYGGREHLVNQLLFGPLPLFRIPRMPKAAFLDIEGTLLAASTERQEMRQAGVPLEIKKALEVLAYREGTLLFFATTLPYQEARKRCQNIWHLFSGGVFAAGAHIVLRSQKEQCIWGRQQIQEGTGTRERTFFYALDEQVIGYIQPVQKAFSARMLVYRANDGRCYKITLLRARQIQWSEKEAEQVRQCLPHQLSKTVRCLVEGHCMQIVAAQASKAAGVRMVCGWLGIGLEHVFAAGDASEDVQMKKMCGC